MMKLTAKPRIYLSCTHWHLGDMINSVNIAHEEAVRNTEFDYFIYCNYQGETVAKKRPQESLKEVLGLIDTPIRYLPSGPENSRTISPHWVKWAKQNPPQRYVKARNLPTQREDYITIQTNSRSTLDKGLFPEEDVRLVEVIQPHRVINLSDQEIPNTTFLGDASLREKLEVIAKAKAHIGVNSGMIHLALMTNTPIVLISIRYKEEDSLTYDVIGKNIITVTHSIEGIKI